MKRAILALALSVFIQDDEVSRIEERFRASRPTDDQLRFYKLDWARDLAEAKARAAKEKRPIFFIAITNITGPDTFFTGHC